MAMALSVTTTSLRLRAVVAAVPAQLPNSFVVLLSQAARPRLRLGAARPTRLPVPLAASFSEDPRGSGVERPSRDVARPSFRLHVSNLSSKVDESKLAEMFGVHGKVAFTKVIRDYHSNRSKGFGFVEMASQEEMYKAITALHGQSLEGRVIRVIATERPGETVSEAAPGGDPVESLPPRHGVGPSFRLHVNNLPFNVDDSRLAQMFSQHGSVVKVVRDERSNGFGFVEMASQEDMDNAITALHGQVRGHLLKASATNRQICYSFKPPPEPSKQIFPAAESGTTTQQYMATPPQHYDASLQPGEASTAHRDTSMPLRRPPTRLHRNSGGPDEASLQLQRSIDSARRAPLQLRPTSIAARWSSDAAPTVSGELLCNSSNGNES